jgi:glycosyltransferase involved in cell wall biosynthesis
MNDSIPLISVLVSVYNAGIYIEKSIYSIVGQTFRDFELILTDDRGSDGSFETARKIIDSSWLSENTRYIINDSNRGIAMSRQAALEKAVGKYIIYLDCDDYFEPDLLELMYEYAEKNGSDLVVCAYTKELPKGKSLIVDEASEGIPAGEEFDRGLFVERMLTSKVGCSLWNKMFKRELMTENDIAFDSEMRDDLSVSPKLVWNALSVSFISKPLVHFVQYNITSGTYSFSHLKMVAATLPHLDEYFLKRGADFSQSILRYKAITKRKLLLFRQKECALNELCALFPELSGGNSPAFYEPKLHYRLLLFLAHKNFSHIIKLYRGILRLFCTIYTPA